MVIGGLKCPYFSCHSDCELILREEELGREEDEGVGDLLQVREGEDGRRLRGKNAMLLILHLRKHLQQHCPKETVQPKRIC